MEKRIVFEDSVNSFKPGYTNDDLRPIYMDGTGTDYTPVIISLIKAIKFFDYYAHPMSEYSLQLFSQVVLIVDKVPYVKMRQLLRCTIFDFNRYILNIYENTLFSGVPGKPSIARADEMFLGLLEEDTVIECSYLMCNVVKRMIALDKDKKDILYFISDVLEIFKIKSIIPRIEFLIQDGADCDIISFILNGGVGYDSRGLEFDVRNILEYAAAVGDIRFMQIVSCVIQYGYDPHDILILMNSPYSILDVPLYFGEEHIMKSLITVEEGDYIFDLPDEPDNERTLHLMNLIYDNYKDETNLEALYEYAKPGSLILKFVQQHA
jgi:hypothetical protein